MLNLTRKNTGFFLGITFFFAVLIIVRYSSMDSIAGNTAAVAVLMAVWWISDAIPLAATALLPVVFFPLFRIVPAKQIVLSYADSNVLLFLGGFLIALAMQKHNLHKRIALKIISWLGTSYSTILLGFMLATAFLSMWISNTATAMMMLPIGIAVIQQVGDIRDSNDYKKKGIRRDLSLALMLGIAYSASIGGIGTIIGTPPNIIFSGVVKSMFPELPEIDFITWMSIGLPVVIVFIPLTWLYLNYTALPAKRYRKKISNTVIRDEFKLLGKMSRGERLTLIVFIFTSLGWIFRKDIDLNSFRIPGWSGLLGVEDYVNDSTVALFGGLILFVLPVDIKKSEFVLNWEWAKKLPWGILILFGGGFALAKGFQSSGLDLLIGQTFSRISTVYPLILILSVCLLLTFLTEFTSNTATISMFLPVLAAMSTSINVNPFILMIPATISTSCAFMMPVATPPNAIVFGSGYIQIHEMARVGLVMNFVGVFIISLLMYLVAFPLLGIAIH